MNKITNYHEINEFFKDAIYEIEQKRKTKLSYRGLAKLLNFKNHASLHQMLIRKRKISKQVILKLSKILRLTQLEAEYLQILAKKENSNFTNVELERIARKINSTTPVVIDNAEIQRDPIHFSILELVLTNRIKLDFVYIQKKLVKKYSIVEIQDAVARLENAKLIQINEDKFIERINRNFIFSVQDEINLDVRKYISSLCDMAKIALMEQSVEDRECSSVMFNIKMEELQNIKTDIRNFIRDLMNKYEAKEYSNSLTYNLNTHFFKISQPGE